MDPVIQLPNGTHQVSIQVSDPYMIWLVIGTFIIAGVTLLGILLSNRRTKESIDLTRREMEARLKPVLHIEKHMLSNMTDKPIQYTKFKCELQNTGKSPASDYLSYCWYYLQKPNIEKLVRDEKKIKIHKRLTEGLLPPTYLDYIDRDFTWQIDNVNKSWIVLWFEYTFLDKIAHDETVFVIGFEKSAYRGEDIYDKISLESARKQFLK